MTSNSFTIELKRTLPESSWPWVFSALREDPLIWENLSGELGMLALKKIGNNPEGYSPAALILLDLDYPASLESLRATPMKPIHEHLRQRASRALARDRKNDPANPTVTLTEAGLLALNLRERRREKGSWMELTSDLRGAPPTTLACLFAMIPDPLDLLKNISAAQTGSEEGVSELILHTLLSNPLPPEAQSQILKAVITKIPNSARLQILRRLADQNPLMASRLAGDPEVNLSAEEGQQTGNPLDQLHQMLRLTETYHLAAQSHRQVSLLTESLSVARRLQGWLSAQLAQAAAENGDPSASLAAWEQAVQLDPASAANVGGLALALIRADRSADARTHLEAFDSSDIHSQMLLARARLSQPERSVAFLRQVLDRVENGEETAKEACLSEITQFLLELNQPGEAMRAAQLNLAAYPNQPKALSLLAHTYQASGDTRSWVHVAHLAVALCPSCIGYRRHLADGLEATGEWQAALDERVRIVEQMEIEAGPSAQDLRQVANCALRAGLADQAIQPCRAALELDDSDGLAYALLGEATAALGDSQAALGYLERATQLAPQQADPWLALARIFQNNGDPQKALETLRAATRAAPQLPEVHLELGENYLADNSPTQALACLRRAANLVNAVSHSPGIEDHGTAQGEKSQNPLSSTRDNLVRQIALRLGQTLHQLGHLAEARQTLEPAYLASPADPQIALAYARVLLDLGEKRLSLAPLEVVLQSKPQETGPYLAYARSLLALGNDPSLKPEAALSALQHILEIEPDHSEAKALLAEALAAKGRLLAAMDAYRDAMETELSQEPDWQSRLALGLGRVALKLGQIETAVAALQEANQADPLNAQIQRTLSEAYDAAGLTDSAFQAARAALLLAPADLETLIWFVDQALDLRNRPGVGLSQVQSEAINALTRATHLAPLRTDLLLKLGQIQFEMGEQAAARTTFSKLASLEIPGEGSDELSARHNFLADLHQAARGLLKLGDPGSAVACLERALQTNPLPGEQVSSSHTPDEPSLLDLLTDLATARNQAGKPQAALQALDQAINIAPTEALLFVDKANLLLEMEQPNAALSCLETALDLKPEDPALHKQAAAIQRAAGNLPLALDHAEKMIALFRDKSLDQSAEELAARSLAADLARAMLLPVRAYTYLENFQLPSAEQSLTSERLNFHCTRAELALDAGQELIATNELAAVFELAADHPRVLAIQSRLTAHRGDFEAAGQFLRDAAQAIKHPQRSEKSGQNAGVFPESDPFSRVTIQRSVAEAALELHSWDTALSLLEQAVSIAPLEPQIHLSRGRALVMRAEFQRLCQEAQAVHQAPGEVALSEEAYQVFQEEVEISEQQVSHWSEKDPAGSTAFSFTEYSEEPQSQIHRWRARGMAAFQPNPDSAQALAAFIDNAEDVAAYMACLRQAGNVTEAGKVARGFPQNPLVLLQLALTLVGEKPRQALAAANAALESLNISDPRVERSAQRKEIAPFIHALLSHLLTNSGNRFEDHASALQEIQTALQLSPNEPRWHALAAQIYLKRDNPEDLQDAQAAIAHLERAIQLEPNYAPHYLALAKIYLQEGVLQTAIQTIEQATRLAPEEPEPWMILAQGQQAVGDLEQAAANAERAVTLSPEQIQPLLLRGEISLQANNPRGAQSRAQAALRIKPDDSGALLLLARSYTALDHPDEALAAIEKALPLSQNPLPLYLERVRLLRRSQGHKAALPVLQELAKRYPNESSVLAPLAEVLEENGKSEAAIQVAQLALRADQERPDLPSYGERARLHHLLGRLLSRAGQLDQAIHHLSEAIHLAPDVVEPYLELGRVHQERRQYALSLSTYQQAIDAVPGDPRAYYQAGLALKESKDYLEAEKMLRQAADLAPNDLSIHRLLGAVVALNLVHNRHEAPLKLYNSRT